MIWWSHAILIMFSINGELIFKTYIMYLTLAMKCLIPLFLNTLSRRKTGWNHVMILIHLSFLANAEALSAASSRALGLIRYKLKFLKECRSTIFARLFKSYVCPIFDYGAGYGEQNHLVYLSKYSDGPYVICWDFIVLLQ